MSEGTHLSRRDSFRAALLSLAAASLAASMQPLKHREMAAGWSRISRALEIPECSRAHCRADTTRTSSRCGRDPYLADYEKMADRATRMREGGIDIPLAEALDTGPYEAVLLGFPIWGGDLPAVMASFLRSYGLAGKTVISFITHGGYGQGSAMRTARAVAPAVAWREPFVPQDDQKRDILRRLDAGLESGVVRP
jgi:hypothetical protein